jgi:hypothetical protein
MYIEKNSLKKLKEDVAGFMQVRFRNDQKLTLTDFVMSTRRTDS